MKRSASQAHEGSEGGIVKLQVTGERTLEQVLEKNVVALVFLFWLETANQKYLMIVIFKENFEFSKYMVRYWPQLSALESFKQVKAEEFGFSAA